MQKKYVVTTQQKRLQICKQICLKHLFCSQTLFFYQDHNWCSLRGTFSPVRPLRFMTSSLRVTKQQGQLSTWNQVKALSSSLSSDILGSISRSPLPSEDPFMIVAPAPCDLIFILVFVRDLQAVVTSTTAAAKNTNADVAKRCSRIRCKGLGEKSEGFSAR